MLQFSQSRDRAFLNMLARDKIRLRHTETGEYLHLSGQGTTRDVNYSWLGFAYQAENLRRSAGAAPEDWPPPPPAFVMPDEPGGGVLETRTTS